MDTNRIQPNADRMQLDCGHTIAAGERWVSLAGSSRCYDCQTAEDKKYLRLPTVDAFTARVASDGGTIENGIGGTLATVEWYEERKRAEVRTPDGRRWVSTNPIRNFFTRFELLQPPKEG